MAKHWLDYQMEDIPFEDWDVLAKADYEEYMQLRREERYDIDHRFDDIYDEKEGDEDEY